MKWKLVLIIIGIGSIIIGSIFTISELNIINLNQRQREGISAFATTGNWTIDGNAVYVDDSNVYIKASPHTLTSSGWVYFNITSKVYEGDVDVVFGFNTTIAKPKRIELYKPHTITWNTTNSKIFYNVSSFETTSADCEYGFEYNTFKRNGTHTEPIFDEEEHMIIIGWNKTSSIVCFDSYTQEGNNYTLTWHQENSKVEDYIDKTSSMSSIDYEYEEMNKWWYVKDISINQNQNYMFRGWVDIPIGYNTGGKYWFAIKPSSETIPEAIANEHLYALDPWYNSSFERCKNITISNVGDSTLTNFPAYINITNTTNMLSNYLDLRFVNASCSGDGGSQLDHEIENYTSSKVDVWVRIPSLPSAGTNISVYYKNNTAVTDGQNPTGVWDSNYVGVWHLKESCDAGNCTLDSTQYDNDGTPTTNLINYSGIINGAYSFDGGGSEEVEIPLTAELDIGEEMTLTIWFKKNGWVSQDGFVGVLGGWQKQKYGIWTEYRTGYISFFRYNSNTHYDVDIISVDYYDGGRTFVAGVSTGGDLKIYAGKNESIDNVDGGYDLAWDDGGTNPLTIGSWGGSNDISALIDEVRVSNTSRSADWINQSYLMVVNQSTYIVFGNEESDDEPAGDCWAEITGGIYVPSGCVYYVPSGSEGYLT